MALIFPSIENIERLKVTPQPGEWFLIKHLIDTLDDSYEIYFQPFLNGDRPDIILMKKGSGVVIIEVKDWNLSRYIISENNTWSLISKNDQLISSPFRQVFNYKSNLFSLHINGLIEKKIKNNNFYKIIKPFVYFHNHTKNDINKLFEEPQKIISLSISKANEERRKFISSDTDNQPGMHKNYEKKMKYLKQKSDQLKRDKDISITKETIDKITNWWHFKNGNTIFTSEIYIEFKRLLQPPFHELIEGIEINYEKKQLQYCESKDEHIKIKGVAGSGKTAVLAKRAVNAHKRHNSMVLILTYNLALKSYIRDRISDVREDFSWEYFYINNYHQIFRQTLNQHNISMNSNDNQLSEEEMEQVYSNANIFKPAKNKIEKYKTILIDEAQDYDNEWIKIIREYFLEDNGEMVLFGDEKQNIYQRALDLDKNYRTPNGFGIWKALNKSIRHDKNSYILKLAKDFQKTFLNENYDIDKYEDNAIQQEMPGLGIFKVAIYSDNQIPQMVSTIYRNIKEQNLHPNDVVILSSRIKIMQEFDYIIRNKSNHKTITTFEDKELSEILYNDLINLYNLRRSKKVWFNHNPGITKLATTHSFKGFESPTVFLILNEKDEDEIVYTAITRAKFNIMIFLRNNSKYKSFLQSHCEEVQLAKS